MHASGNSVLASHTAEIYQLQQESHIAAIALSSVDLRRLGATGQQDCTRRTDVVPGAQRSFGRPHCC